jgi:hypothetical protein
MVADVILIGCVRTKHAAACAAAELFASPLFGGRRRYAVSIGLPWYILSTKFGLLAPEDVIGPYDVYLADQSPDYRKALGDFVTAQLEQQHRELRGRTVEVHAGAAYVEPLRAPLAARGAAVAVPLEHLRQGEQLAWYGTHPDPHQAAASPSSAAEPIDRTASLAGLLSDLQQALKPRDLLARGLGGLQVPGLYSWWVDEAGAADLSRGLGMPVARRADLRRTDQGDPVAQRQTVPQHIVGPHHRHAPGRRGGVLHLPADARRDPRHSARHDR